MKSGTYQAKTRFEDVHPTRWRRTRAFAGAVTRALAADDPSKGYTEDGVQESFQEMMEAYNPAISKIPREKRPENPMDVMTPELTIALYAGSFWAGNRNIVAMDPSVLALLRHTDADDVPMQAVHWTHPFVYVALPQGAGISLPGAPNEVDGAYVDMRLDGHIQIAITTRRTDVETRRQTWPLSVEPYYTFRAELQAGETVGALVARCVADRAAELRDRESSKQIEAAVKEANESENGHSAGRYFESVSKENNARRADNVEAGAAAAAEALSLIVNLMCYLSTEPETKRDYSPRPPRTLLDKVANGTERQKRVAREEMFRLGILPILVAGRGSEPEGAVTGSATTGAEMPSHWRRGHYNTYWTGAGRTVPRIRWIRPQVVNGHKGSPQGAHFHPVVVPSA